MTMNLEVDVIPVSDVDRSKQFYSNLGWRFDAYDAPMDGLRVVQFTPPGSGRSVCFGKGITTAMPGWAEATLTVPTPSRPMTNSSAVASTPPTCGTARRSRSRRGSRVPTPITQATGRSAPSAIRTGTYG
jgi:catechol 2,3-dioxygenase-like lactoylglutathione lyase family enzyme